MNLYPNLSVITRLLIIRDSCELNYYQLNGDNFFFSYKIHTKFIHGKRKNKRFE